LRQDILKPLETISRNGLHEAVSWGACLRFGTSSAAKRNCFPGVLNSDLAQAVQRSGTADKKKAQFQTRWVQAEILAQNRNNGTKATDFIKQKPARSYPECQNIHTELNPARGDSLDSNRLPSNNL